MTLQENKETNQSNQSEIFRPKERRIDDYINLMLQQDKGIPHTKENKKVREYE